MDRKNILVMTPSLPFPPNWGFAIRVYQIIRHLSRSHNVTVLSFARASEVQRGRDLTADTGATVVTVEPGFPDRPRRAAQLLSMLQPVSHSTGNLTSPKMAEALAKLLRENKFDLIQVESSQLGKYDFGNQSVLVLDEHNIEYELLQRMYQTESHPLRRLFNWCEYTKLRREERDFWEKAHGLVMTSEREAVVVRAEMPGKPITVAPNGVDIDFFQPVTAPVDPNSIVFTGLMRYRPNIDAALFFCQEVFPLVLKERPQTVFTIVGMGQPPEIDALANKNVVVTGAVDDVRPYVEGAAISAVPLRMGSGTRLKVLEGLAMGKAMVSTSVGCEGIDVRNNQHLMIADDPASFASAIVRLLNEPELRATLGMSGRRLAEEKYSWSSVVSDLQLFYDELLGSQLLR